MSMDLRSFLPNRVGGQMALIVVASLLLIHIVVTALIILSRSDHEHERPPVELASLVRLIDAMPADARTLLTASAAKVFPQLELALAAAVPAAVEPGTHDAFVDRLQHGLGAEWPVAQIAPANVGDRPRVSVRLGDGMLLLVKLPPGSSLPPAFAGPVVLSLLFVGTSVAALGCWAARALTEPLRSLAAAAENFEPDGELAPLPERGPLEICVAAQALNRMRGRIKQLVEARARTLAAVSHDLRTPITRLRLRSEFIEDQALRTAMLDELAHMNSMVESILVYLRGGNYDESATLMDLATSVETICDAFCDVGHTVRYRGPNHLAMQGHAEALRRAVTNLVDNAVRYGREVTVRLFADETIMTIAVEDDGPGIDDADKELMQQPFVRGDAARGMNDNNGFGLGLSIARAVADAHGGTLELLDRSPRGLIARMTLPRRSPA